MRPLWSLFPPQPALATSGVGASGIHRIIHQKEGRKNKKPVLEGMLAYMGAKDGRLCYGKEGGDRVGTDSKMQRGHQLKLLYRLCSQKTLLVTCNAHQYFHIYVQFPGKPLAMDGDRGDRASAAQRAVRSLFLLLLRLAHERRRSFRFHRSLRLSDTRDALRAVCALVNARRGE
ncbi:hypothetical protein NDU88_001690 [Pleurodeles waltl]|uniref:Uncharacterized protein n=1 Tax=Pleurodeles waltl TaxID=8319 RepID=A0AAV7T0P4_PLEWA|nr:hypothetical protein NDU88_001690 [Pleurodeles waltl]